MSTLSCNAMAAEKMLTAMGFEKDYIHRAFQVYEMQFGNDYNVELMAEVIVRLQKKDKQQTQPKYDSYSHSPKMLSSIPEQLSFEDTAEKKQSDESYQSNKDQRHLSPIPEQLSSEDTFENKESDELLQIFYGTEYEIKCNQTFAYYVGYVSDYDEKQQTLQISYSWKPDQNVPVHYVRPLPSTTIRTNINDERWKPKQGDSIEVQARAGPNEPYGWWPGIVKDIRDNVYAVEFVGWESKQGLFQLDMLRPYNSQNPFESDGIIRELADIAMEKMDEHRLRTEQCQLKKIAKHTKLIHLNYCPFEGKYILIGTSPQISDAKMLIDFSWDLQQKYDTEMENERLIQKEYNELNECVDIKFTFNIGIKDENIELAQQIPGVKHINISYVSDNTVQCVILASDECIARKALSILKNSNENNNNYYSEWERKYHYLNYEYQTNKQLIDHIMQIWNSEIDLLNIDQMNEEGKHLLLKDKYDKLRRDNKDLMRRLNYETNEHDLLRLKYNEKDIECDKLSVRVKDLLDESSECEQKIDELRKKVELYEGKRNCLKTLQMEELDELETKLFDGIKHVQDARKRLMQNKYKCIICLENPKNVALDGCIHVVLCEVCEHKLQHKICPICRVPYNGIKKIKF